MTDITAHSRRRHDKPGKEDLRTGDNPAADESMLHLIELMYFAYRDFTAEADVILSEIGFGRAHHRALHFISRHPGIRVADLLEILKITKQSLARVLKELRDRGYIIHKAGKTDRRERLLYLTPDGTRLACRLTERQANRLRGALVDAGVTSELIERFLFHIISAEEREYVASLIRSGEQWPYGLEESDERECDPPRETASAC